MKHYGDITKLNGAELPIVDVICGGSPCQDLSVAGKRAGLDGERSGLFMDQVRIVKEQRDECLRQIRVRGTDEPIRPRYMVWENVPGAFSSNKGEDFRAVLEETAKIAEKDAVIPGLEKGEKWSNSGLILGDGWSIAWRLHDSQFWGVPQRRKRLCVLADFNGDTAGKILFELQREAFEGMSIETITDIGDESRSEVQTLGKGLPGNIEQSGQEGQGVATDVEGCPNQAVSFQERAGCPGGGKGLLIQNEKTGALATHPQSVCFEPGAASRLGGYCYEEVSGTLRAEMGDNQFAVATEEPILLSTNQNDAELSQTGICNTLPAAMGMGGGYVPMVTYGLDRASFNQGQNAQFDFSVEEELAPTLVNRGPGGGTDTVRALCARDYKGVGNQYVSEGKLIIQQICDEP